MSITSTNTQELKFHPLADLFPLMEGAEFDELVADIKKCGQQAQIVLKDGMILDGRNRYRACLAAGIEPMFACEAYSDRITDPVAFVVAANIRRRHLKPEDKIKILAQLVAAHPEKSDRQHAKEAGVSHPTMAKARRKAEATGKALPVDKRVGADGKARKKPKPKPAAASTGNGGGTIPRAATTSAPTSTGGTVHRDIEAADAAAGVTTGMLGTVFELLNLFVTDPAAWQQRMAKAGTEGKRKIANSYRELAKQCMAAAQALDDEIESAQGNGSDPEASAEKRKTEFAALADAGAITGTPASEPTKNGGRTGAGPTRQTRPGAVRAGRHPDHRGARGRDHRQRGGGAGTDPRFLAPQVDRGGVVTPARSVSVSDGRRTIGSVVERNDGCFEAISVAGHSVGTFSHEPEAATALWKHDRAVQQGAP